MSSVTLTFNDTASIVHNGRDVEFKLYATAYCYYSKATRNDPEESGTEIEDLIISDAHYVDTNESVDSDEIYDEVEKDINDNFERYFTYEEDEEDRYSSEMDCVDRWRVAHGIEV